MGRPKHLLRSAGRTWLEHAAAAVAPVVDGVVVLGPGRMPAALGELPRLPDVAGVGGPLAGFHAAMRWQPFATWLFLACDMPLVSPEAVQWLLGQRAPGVWAVLPRRAGGGVEPLFAWYGFRARALLGSCRGPSEIAAHPKVRTPLVPPHLASAWENANTPADRRRLCRTVPAHRGPQCCASPDPRVSGRVARLQCR
jgi:molybdopterin-guanine dinucleotide biosynthesis protein A